ncbi:MAG: hypothetical protein AB1758_04165 [Candidatus Eremiobacterota bacterium]
MSFSVGVPAKDGYGLTTYTVSREGNRIDVTPPDDGTRGGWGYSIELQADQVNISGPEQYRLEFSPEGVWVSDPRQDGMRGGASMTLETPLTPDQYHSVGLAVASSLIGVPLPESLLK